MINIVKDEKDHRYHNHAIITITFLYFGQNTDSNAMFNVNCIIILF